MKLDLGCGNWPRAEHEGVDFFAPNAKHKVNLFAFPWPWADSSVDGLSSSHFLEHIPMVYVSSAGDIKSIPTHPDDRDLLCKFMDECYRILKPGGQFHITVPSGRSNRGFQDPTHRRFFVAESFYYFSATWREQNGLGHYLCSCDFEFRTWPTVPNALMQLPEQVQKIRYDSEWNTTLDWNCILTSKKKA